MGLMECAGMLRVRDDAAERLKEIREAKYPRVSRKGLGKSLDVHPNTIQKLEEGRQRLTIEWVMRLAQELSFDPDALLIDERNGNKSSTATDTKPSQKVPSALELNPLGYIFRDIPVIGVTQAGMWREAVTLPLDQQRRHTMPIPASFATFPVAALEVHGPSMNEIISHGSLAIVVRLIDLGREPRHGDLVVATRTRADDLHESTIKEFRIGPGDGRPRLWPRSTHPDFQAPIALDDLPDGETLEISHVVIAYYRPLL